MQKDKLVFGRGNAKLNKDITTFSIPSGYTCPGAYLCKSFADRMTGKIKDGPDVIFRCFSASQESFYPSLRKSRWDNFELLKQCKTKEEYFHLIKSSLPDGTIYRIHISGDFFNQNYFDAWLDIAAYYPTRLFYAYTKSLQFWVKRRWSIPFNLKLIASKGGNWDNLISQFNLRYSEVVYSTERAVELGLKIDHDDSLAYETKENFALLIHGTGPAYSLHSIAMSNLKKQGWTGYKRR